MNGFWHVLRAVLAVVAVLPMGLAFAQKSLPQVPVTYAGDTDKTILRRAQWIEAAKKEGTLAWWGTSSPAEGKKLTAEFNKIYPFITVNYWRGKGEEVAAKLEAEIAGGRSSVDITLGGEPYNYPRWRKMGVLEKFADIVPGFKSMDKRMYSKYNDWVVPGNNSITPQYNTNMVSKAEAPKSWEDLLDPKWKGQIALTTDVKGWTTLALEEGGWGIEKTEDFLRKLKEQKPIWVSSRPGANSLLIAGEFKIMGETYLQYIFQTQDKGAPTAWSRVKPVPITGSSFALQKNAPHPNAAKLFLEWLFSPQGLAAFEATTGKGAAFPGSGTRLAKALEGLPLVYRTEEGEIKSIELALDKRFAKLLGVTME